MKYTPPTNINKQKLKDVNSGSVIEFYGHYYLVTTLYTVALPCKEFLQRCQEHLAILTSEVNTIIHLKG